MNLISEKNPLASMQEEIRIFKKNEEATYDILALYELLLQNQNIHNLIGITLVEKVIHDLEDPEIHVTYKGDSFSHLLRTLEDEYHGILKKYEGYEECQECSKQFVLSYKENIFYGNFSSDKRNQRFNLIQELLNQSPQFVYKFLVSEIPASTRLDMFSYVLGCYQLSQFYYFLEGPKEEYLSSSERSVSARKMQEILDDFNMGKCRICNKKMLIEHLLKDNRVDYIMELQDYGIDFNSCTWQFPYEKDITLSTVGVLFYREQSIASFRGFYEATTYLKVDKKVRENNDLLILGGLSMSELPIFIRLSHFEMTVEKLEVLISSVMNTIASYESQELLNFRDKLKKQCFNIADAIVRKSRNKEEFKIRSGYAKLFLELTDVDKEIKKREERDMERQLLEQKRQELACLLYNMNEYAMDNIAPRTQIRNISFHQ